VKRTAAQRFVLTVTVFRFFIRTTIPRGSGAVPGCNTESQPTTSELAQTEPFSVLVVEDNVISQTVLRRQLVKAGLSCDGEDETRQTGLTRSRKQRARSSASVV
jgi:hypothetical protein